MSARPEMTKEPDDHICMAGNDQGTCPRGRNDQGTCFLAYVWLRDYVLGKCVGRHRKTHLTQNTIKLILLVSCTVQFFNIPACSILAVIENNAPVQ